MEMLLIRICLMFFFKYLKLSIIINSHSTLNYKITIIVNNKSNIVILIMVNVYY